MPHYIPRTPVHDAVETPTDASSGTTTEWTKGNIIIIVIVIAVVLGVIALVITGFANGGATPVSREQRYVESQKHIPVLVGVGTANYGASESTDAIIQQINRVGVPQNSLEFQGVAKKNSSLIGAEVAITSVNSWASDQKIILVDSQTECTIDLMEGISRCADIQ